MFLDTLNLMWQSVGEIVEGVAGGKIVPAMHPGLSPEQVHALSQMQTQQVGIQAQVEAQQQVQSLVSAQQAHYDRVTDALQDKIDHAAERAFETGDWSHVDRLQDQ